MAASNTEKLGINWRGLAWGDGKPVPRATLPDGNYAEVVSAFPYRPVLFAVIDAAASGDNTLVAAVASLKIKVISYTLVCSGAVSVRWKSGAGTNLSGAMAFAANGGLSAPGSEDGHLLETAVNTDLVLNLSGPVQVSGHLAYFTEA